jgi:hypothetical protein
MKAGVQFSWMVDSLTTGVPGNTRYTDQNTVPGKYCVEADPTTFQFCSKRAVYVGNQADGSLGSMAHVSNTGAFIQDRWTVNRQLTLVPGIRLDVGKLYGMNGFLTNQVGIGPRLSLTYDLFADRKHLIVAHYGRSNDVGNVFIAQHLNPSLAVYTSKFNNTTGAFTDCVNAYDPAFCTLAGGPNGRTIAPHQAAPHTDEIAAGYHFEAAELTVMGIDLNYRRYANLWADQEINAVYDSTGTRIVGGLNGKKQSILQGVTPGSAYRDYKSVDVWVQGTPGPWDLNLSYTLSFTTGTVADYFDGYLQNPRFDPFYEGNIPDDRRHVIKASVSYHTTWGMTFGGVFGFHSGNPVWESFTNNGDSTTSRYRTPRGAGFPVNPSTNQPDFNDPASWASLLNPDQLNLGVLARYNLGQVLGLKEQKAEITFYMVNVTDTAEAQSLNGSFSPSASRNVFGYAGSHASPLQGEVILRFRN